MINLPHEWYFFATLNNYSIIILVGNYGNQLDRTEEKVTKEVDENPYLNSLSSPARPVTNNRQYYHIPWDDAKPCLHIKFPWQDHRRRLYNANIIYKICERFVSICILLGFVFRPSDVFCKANNPYFYVQNYRRTVWSTS